MVYMAGDNNLDPNGVADLMEMKKTGSTANVNVIAQFDRGGSGIPTKRYFLQNETSLDTDAVQSLDETNTGDPAILIDFIKWGIAGYPADHYMLVLWNHGQGWDDTDIYAGERSAGERLVRPAARMRHAFFKTSLTQVASLQTGDSNLTRAILLDDNAKDFLDNKEMKAVLETTKTLLGRKLDVLGMDACLMNMAEVAYQIRDSVLFTAGSEETEPLDGWPYDTILRALSGKPTMGPKELSACIVKNYLTSYKGGGEAVTFSACDISRSDTIASAVKALAAALKAGLADKATRTAIIGVRNQVQDYFVQDNIDLADLCTLLKASAPSKTVITACDKVLSAIKEFVIASGYYGGSMKHSNGVAIYFPTRTVSPLYAGLDFSIKTGWGAFLKKYMTTTRSR